MLLVKWAHARIITNLKSFHCVSGKDLNNKLLWIVFPPLSADLPAEALTKGVRPLRPLLLCVPCVKPYQVIESC